MSRQHNSPNPVNHPTDPLFDLLADGPTIEASASHKLALRERLMDFPPLAGLITLHLPFVGRVFIPRIASVLGLLAIGAGLSAFVAFWPFERTRNDEPVSALMQTQRDVRAELLEREAQAAMQNIDALEAERALERGAELRAFDPPRAPVVLSADVPAPPEAAPPPVVIAAVPTSVPPPTAVPVQEQAPEPKPEKKDKKEDPPTAVHTPTPTQVAAQPGSGGVLPPTATPQPTAEGRPTLLPLPPTTTPEPSPTPVP